MAQLTDWQMNTCYKEKSILPTDKVAKPFRLWANSQFASLLWVIPGH
jgi:hypothetical protein